MFIKLYLFAKNHSFSINQIIPYLCPSKREHKVWKNILRETLITTALPYANGPVHIGHLAGVYVPADIYARYLRLKGEEVLMIGGSDEHGVPITLRAKKEGITPQDVVDVLAKAAKETAEEPAFQDALQKLNLNYAWLDAASFQTQISEQESTLTSC